MFLFALCCKFESFGDEYCLDAFLDWKQSLLDVFPYYVWNSFSFSMSNVFFSRFLFFFRMLNTSYEVYRKDTNRDLFNLFIHI